jgi:hypothetical protein
MEFSTIKQIIQEVYKFEKHKQRHCGNLNISQPYRPTRPVTGIPFFIASGVGLSPLYCGHFWPTVPAPDDRWGWLWSNWWNEDWQGKPKYSEKTCSSATLSTTNPTWSDPGSNACPCSGRPATDRLSYGVAHMDTITLLFFFTKVVKLFRFILSAYITGSLGKLMYYFVGIMVISKSENHGGNG